MKSALHHSWVIIAIVFVLIQFGCTPNDLPPQSSSVTIKLTNTILPTTVSPSITPSPKLPTYTATDLPPTSTRTIIPTLTKTPTVIPPSLTPTDEPPLVSISGYTVCRYGPGTRYPVHTSFKEDRIAWARGRLEDNTWFMIELPEIGETCWIFYEIVELDNETNLLAVLTPPPKPTPAPVPTKSKEEKELGPKYYLIIPDNGGPFACGDGLVYYYSGIKSKETEDDIKVALNALFSVREEYVGDHYNPVYKSSLKVKGVDIEDGQVTIWLSGKFVKPRSVCEAKRIHLQIWKTARLGSTIKQRPIIYVHNALLGDLLQDVKD